MENDDNDFDEGFGDTLYEKEVEVIRAYVWTLQLKNIRILDVGCGEGTFISELWNKLTTNISSIVGIDNEMPMYGHENPIDIFDEDFAQIHNGTVGNTPIPDGLVELIKVDAFDYLRDTDNKYEVIILSNVLHFYNQKKRDELLTLISERLEVDGFIYIKVANEHHEEAPHPMTLTEINQLIKFGSIRGLVHGEHSVDFVIEKMG